MSHQENGHPSVQRMARFGMESDTGAQSEEKIAFLRHIAGCAACRETYGQVREALVSLPVPDMEPLFYPAPDALPDCAYTERLAEVDKLPLREQVAVWAHVVWGRCPDCIEVAKALGDAFPLRPDPATRALIRRLGARSPRQETPGFSFAMAGGRKREAEADVPAGTEVMNAKVLLSPRPGKKEYQLAIYRLAPTKADGLWQVRVQFAPGTRLPRGFILSVYRQGSPETPLCTSQSAELELQLPEGMYFLNLDHQDYLPLPLMREPG